MSLEKYTPKQIAYITEATTKKYGKMPDYDAVALGKAISRVEELNAFAQRDLGLNLEHLKVTLEAHELLLQSESEDPDNDQFIGFLREQIAFSQRMATTVKDISTTSLQVTGYQQRLEAARAAQIIEHKQGTTKYYDELPDGFYKGKKLEHFLKTDNILANTTHEFMTDLGVRHRLDRHFSVTKILFITSKFMHYNLNFFNDDEPLDRPEGNKIATLWYENSSNRDSLCVHVPLLVPKKTPRGIYVEEAFTYLDNPSATELRYPAIFVKQIDEESIRKLLTIIVAGKEIV